MQPAPGCMRSPRRPLPAPLQIVVFSFAVVPDADNGWLHSVEGLHSAGNRFFRATNCHNMRFFWKLWILITTLFNLFNKWYNEPISGHYCCACGIFVQKGPDLLTGASPSLARKDRCEPEPAIPGKLTPQNSLIGQRSHGVSPAASACHELTVVDARVIG